MGFSLLRCPHNHLSFPIVTQEPRASTSGTRAAPSPAGAQGPAPTIGAQTNPSSQPHVTCLDCGREFWYDWARMRRLAERPQPIYRRAA